MKITKLDKKCGKSGIPANAKCTKSTAQGSQRKSFSNPYANNVLKLGAGLAAASLTASAAGALVGSRKAPTAPKKPKLLPPARSFSGTQRRAPSIPPKKQTSVTRRLAEIRRKNKANFARPELRDLRAVGLKAESMVKKGASPVSALKKAATPRLIKRRRDLGSFYKDGHAETKNVRDRMAKIMDGYKKRTY